MLETAKNRQTALSKEQMKVERDNTLRRNEIEIIAYERAIEYKKSQIEREEVLEKALPSLETLDGKKPIFILENEIDATNVMIAEMKEKNQRIKEEQAKEAK